MQIYNFSAKKGKSIFNANKKHLTLRVFIYRICMEISFADKKLSKIVNDDKKMVKEFGKLRANSCEQTWTIYMAENNP